MGTCIPLLINIRLDDEDTKSNNQGANRYAAVTIKSSSLWFYQISLGAKTFPYDDSWLCSFTMVDANTDAPRYHVMDIIGQMGLFNNLLPNPDDIIWPGPYWFFGTYVGCIIVYRLFLYRRHWAWNVMLIVLCFAIRLSCEPEVGPEPLEI